MDWATILGGKQIEGKAEDRLKAFLLAEMPPFAAPTDPTAWRRQTRTLRRRALSDIFLKGFTADKLKRFPRIVWGATLRPDPSYVIRKLRYEIHPNYWIPALLYEPRPLRGTMPVVLNPNGHHAGGKAVDYKQIRCANLARRGVIALNMEFIGMGELRGDVCHNNIAHLNLTGVAGVGLFYLALKKGLDILLSHRHADPKRVGVTGLSGGGWQTIVIASLDERINLTVPVAGYTGCRARAEALCDIGDLEQTPVDLTTVLDYEHMTAMLAPNPVLQILNQEDDCCFKTQRAKPVIYDAILPTFRAFGAEDRFEWHSNKDPGTHNYGADNRAQFYRFISKHWRLDAPAQDLNRPEEILPESETEVGLPPAQETFQHMALLRARRLVRALRTLRTAQEKQRLRRRLAEVIRLPQYARQPATPSSGGTETGNCVVCAGPWTIPVSILKQRPQDPAWLIVSDSGRSGSAAARLKRAGNVFVADILGTGENRSNWQYLMLLETCGHRILGHQAAQVMACARFASTAMGRSKIRLIGEGPLASFACLVAAALEPALFESLTVQGNIASLVHIIESAERYETHQPLFCFGLLEVADVPQLTALLDGILYEQPGRAVPPVAGC